MPAGLVETHKSFLTTEKTGVEKMSTDQIISLNPTAPVTAKNGTLFEASRQWAARPADQRFLSLKELHDFKVETKNRARQKGISSRRLEAVPVQGDSEFKALQIIDHETGQAMNSTNWSFGQLAALGKAPAGYLRNLPSPLAADCINYGLHVSRDVEDIGLLTHDDPAGGIGQLTAATGPRYGRVWDSDITSLCLKNIDTEKWTVPGIRGKALSEVTKDNTTLYASDRDMFIFLADEKNRITVDNRRDGQPGTMARGFFLWNSEVGDKTIGIAMFLYDYVCQNRIVWGVGEVTETRLRHTSGAPDRWLEQIQPMLTAYSNSAAGPLEAKIKAAQETKVDKLAEFMAKRYTERKAAAYMESFRIEEGREMESLWDISTGITAYARTIPNTDSRLELEREGGKILELVPA
jgi:hypothetical protein